MCMKENRSGKCIKKCRFILNLPKHYYNIANVSEKDNCQILIILQMKAKLLTLIFFWMTCIVLKMIIGFTLLSN